MKAIFGFVITITGILLGAFLSLYFCAYGGIITVVEAFSADPVHAAGVAWGIVRIILTPVVWWVTVFCSGLIGMFFIVGEDL